MTGVLDQTRLYEMLKVKIGTLRSSHLCRSPCIDGQVMLSADLNDEQIAELVRDICALSDYDGDGDVNVDEFVQASTA